MMPYVLAPTGSGYVRQRVGGLGWIFDHASLIERVIVTHYDPPGGNYDGDTATVLRCILADKRVYACLFMSRDVLDRLLKRWRNIQGISITRSTVTNWIRPQGTEDEFPLAVVPGKVTWNTK